MNSLQHFSKVKAFAFDVDGVLTDGTVLLIDNDVQARRMNIKDGLALQMAIKSGYPVKIISGAVSDQVYNRLKKLGLTDIEMGVKDKKKEIQDFLAKHNLTPDQLLYMGDDLPDLEVLKLVGLPCCPSDAVQEVIDASVYISPKTGGMACVRDVIEKVLKLAGHWNWDTEIASR
jgi:3-deoxy-D-manno-octulosonate 8-phosphate phosphatase (KDO 8-P phosphatase)